jgi:chitodextrinase
MRLLLRTIAVAGALVLLAASPATAAPRDTQPPTIPGNLRTTNVTQTSVSLAWNPSTDNREVLFYGAWAPGLPVIYVNQPGTTATFTGLHPGTTYAFRVQAWDGTNWSWPSTILNVTTRPDVVAPSAPSGLALADSVHGFPVDGVTASKVLVSWVNATDDFGPLTYQILVNGVVSPDVYDTRPAGTPISATSKAWVRQLEPGTTYALTVRAVDGGGNISPVSNAVMVTTDASADTVAPTAPVLTQANSGGTGACPEELWLTWTGATDNVDPAGAIEYEVRVNGVINEVVPGGTVTITYTEVNGPNVVTIVAADRAGNASAPSNSATVVNNWSTGCP